MKKKLKFHIITMATYGQGLSGGDRIWIEVSKRLGKQYKVNVYLWEEGEKIAKREGLNNAQYIIWSAKKWAKFGFLINYLARIIIAIYNAFRLNIENSSLIVVYSASEFWQDSLPAFVLKLRYPKVKWVAAWYQTAPNLLTGFTEGMRESRFCLSAFFYWFVQLLVKPIIVNFADLVLVNNDQEILQFPKLQKQGKVFVMLGALNLDKIKNYRRKYGQVKKVFDGVFIGRFHPQKGVVELIEIWRLVTKDKPLARLAIIGDGPLMKEVKHKIRDLGLEKNITLFGYLFDGPEKYKVFSQSKVVLHPAFFDSGGMAAAEAMAFGLPAVGFNLESFKSYYPHGMVKARLGDLNDFARNILRVLDDKDFYSKMSNQALELIKNWTFDKRTKDFLRKINER